MGETAELLDPRRRKRVEGGSILRSATRSPESGGVTYGVIFEYEEDSWAELCRLEPGYRVVEVEAEPLDAGDDERVECLAFDLPEVERSAKPLRPSARYARKLVAGARLHGLPSAVVADYERLARQGSQLSLSLLWLYPGETMGDFAVAARCSNDGLNARLSRVAVRHSVRCGFAPRRT